MKGFSIIVVISLLGIFACSSGKKKGTEKESLAMDIEKSMDGDQSSGTVGEEEFFAVETTKPVEESPMFEEIVEEEQVVLSDGPKRKVVSKVTVHKLGEYEIQKGDTLLYVSFKLFGDYRLWRKLLVANSGIDANHLIVGSKIKYELPMQPFKYRPRGISHLILSGETLGTISTQHYGTSKKWKAIHKNNWRMIKDPDLIFAGFTLYVKPDQVAAN